MSGISAVKEGFFEGVTRAGAAVGKSAVWAGRTISDGFEKFAQAMNSAWNSAEPFLKDAACKVFGFLRSPAGFAVMGGVLGIIFCVSAETTDKKWIALALRIVAAACFVGAGIAVGLGITQGFTTPLV